MAAPQLRLEVSLNLTGFRGEIRKLTNIAQSEFTPKINVKFNRQTLDTELNNLQAAIKRRTYRVEIGGNIDKLPDKIKALKEELSSLESFKIDLGIGAVKSLSKKDASKIKSDLRAEILGEQTKIYVPVSIKPSITREDVRNFKNTVKSKLTGLSVDVKANVQGGGTGAGLPPDFMKYMAEQGLLGKTASGMTMRMGKDGGDIKQQLSDAVGSAEKIKSIFDGVAQSIATTGKSIANVQGKKLGLANIPLMAGAMEKRIERSASAIEGAASFDALKSLYPEINKTIVSLAALRGQVQQNTSKLSSFSLIIGLAAFAGVPLAKSIVKLTGSADKFSKLLDKLGPNLEAAFTKAAFNILNTASSRLLTGGSAAGLLPPAYRGIGPSAEPAGLLPPAYRGIGPSRNAGALPPAYRGLPFGFDFKGLPPDASAEDQAGGLGPTVQQMRQQLFSSIRIAEVRVREIFDIVGDFDSRQKAAGQAKLDKAVQDFVKGLEDITRRAILRGGVRQVNVDDLGGTVRPALPSGRSPLLLPPAGGTTAVDRIRVSTGAYLGQPGFMQAPSVPSPIGGGGAPPVPPRGGGGGGGFFGGMQFNMPQLPGAGLVREVGEEFGFAAKQVLLYGTAYKALGLLQTFPAQVGEAVGALQSFRNTIGEISPSAKEAADSSQFILDIVEKYNTPLQSARDGFVKLYASMQPAGFSGDEIRDLFLGISQTAATFGMSADKVDRVNYAFAQMASKGQVMSEELKGQLGDVLPGAMAIFAEAAGFKGPEAITKFSKALEDGAYKGGAMKVLLTNVGSIMRKEFGPGAEGAARTFQGVMNRMQNSLKLLYETFEPVAVGFLNSVVMPMTSGLKTVTDGLNAFFTGAATKTSGGFAIAQELEKLRPTFDGIRQNAVQLIPIFGQVAQVILGVGKAFLQIASNPFVGYIARIYLNILALTTAINILNLRALIPMIANFTRSLYALVAFAVQCVSTGSVVQRLGMAVQVTGLMLRTFFATNGIGLVLVGIGLLTERVMSMNQALADTKAKALGASDAIRAMSQTEARQASQQYDKQAQSLKGLSKEIEDGKMKGKAWIEVTKEQAEALKSAGITVSDVRGSLQVQPMRIGGAYQKLEGLASEARFRVRGLDYQDKQVEQQADIAPIPPGTGEDEANKKKTSLESYYSLRDQLTKDATEFAAAQAEEESRHRISLLELYYDTQEARANAYQKDALKFEREMVMIEERRQESRLKAQLEVQKAQGSVAGGAMSGGAGGTGAIFGATGRTFNAPGWVHGHFQNQDREALVKDTVEVVMELLSKGVSPELGSGARFTAGMNAKQVEALVRKGIGSHKQYASGVGAIDVFMPKGTQVPVPVSGIKDLGGAAGVTGSLPRGSQLMHLDPASTVNVAGGGMVPGKVAPSVKRNEMATQNTLQASIAQTTANRMADERAVKEQIATLEKYRAVAFPTIEQDTQNKLLAKRNELFRSGLTSDQVDQEIKLYENQQRGAAALASVQRLYDNGYLKLNAYTKLMEIFNQDIASQNDLLQQNAAYLRQSQFDQAMKGVRNQIDMARALTPEQEMRTQIAQEGFTGAEAESIFQERKTLQGAEKLKADMQGIAGAIGDSFGNAFKGVITGSMTAQEALAGFFQSVADSFADMVAKMIAEYLKMALIKGIMSIMSLIPGLGAVAGGLGGGGQNLGPNSSAVFGLDNPDITKYSLPLEAAANGAVWTGGFTAFANGGVVTGPTLGLVGEGRYNEAVIPLPDGKSVPVQLSGGDGGNQVNTNITVNVSNGQAQSNATGSNSSELGRKLEGAVKQVIVGELRPGGLLASR